MHPHRLLLLVPLALLGAAWLVRARLPRPQTEGDKWLWEIGEQTSKLVINEAFKKTVKLPGRGGLTTVVYSLVVSDRQGIRRLLRSLDGTPAFALLPKSRRKPEPVDFAMSLDEERMLWITHQGNSFLLQRQGLRVAPLTLQEVTHFRQAVQETLLKAKQHQRGYSLRMSGSYTL